MGERIAIIGGGAIGLASAYYLNKNHQELIVIDKGEVGEACSKGNMGWVCPLLTEPVPSPGLITTTLKWMLKRDSPLYIKPTKIPHMVGWLFQFWKYCNRKNYSAGVQALIELQKHTLTNFDELEEEGLQFELHRDGFMFLFLDQKALDETHEQLKEKAEWLKVEKPRKLSFHEVKKLVPSITKEVAGGIFLSDQYHVRPETVWKSFLDKLSTSEDVQIKKNTKVIDFETRNGKVQAIVTDKGTIQVDKILIASGVWSAELLKKLGYRAPIQSGKGYSVTINKPNIEFPCPMYLGDSKAAISPFHGGVRIGGTMELSGINMKMDKRRIKSIRNSISQYISKEIKGEVGVDWMGMRPMTPDGLPVLGRVPNTENAFVATGHGMEGVALSLSTGKIMAGLLCNEEISCDIAPFRPERFTA